MDWGGAYIGPTQLRVLRMAKELGLKMYKVNNVGDWIYYNNVRTNVILQIFSKLLITIIFSIVITFLFKSQVLERDMWFEMRCDCSTLFSHNN